MFSDSTFGGRRVATLSVLGLSAFLGIWWAASLLSRGSFLPGPFDVAGTFFSLLQHPFAGATLFGHMLASFGRFAGGFSLAVLIGIPLGLCAGWSRTFDGIISPLFEATRFVSPIAWVAFAALWFGTGIGGPLLIIFAGAFPPCFINAYRGAQHCDKKLIEAARMMGASPIKIVFHVLFPASFPSIIAGVRVAAGMGWQSLVGAELIVASGGVGYMIVQAQSSVRTAIVIAGMAAIGIVGFAMDYGLSQLEKAFSTNSRS